MPQHDLSSEVEIKQQTKKMTHTKDLEDDNKESDEESSSGQEPETLVIKADKPNDLISKLKEHQDSSSDEEQSDKEDEQAEADKETTNNQAETSASKPVKSRMNIIDSYINRPKEEMKTKSGSKALTEKKDSKNESIKKTTTDIQNLQMNDKKQSVSSSTDSELQDQSDSKSLDTNSQETSRSSTIVTSSPKNDNKAEESARSRITKPSVPKQPKAKKKKAKKQHVEEDQNVIDYSHLYGSFYDIFNSYIQNPKYFDPSVTLRETRNLYSSYISLMDSNILFAAPQFKFEAAPLEKTYYDYAVPNHYLMTGKNLNDMELEVKNRDNEMLRQAYTQAQLKQRYMKLKKMDEESIVQENIEKIKQELKKNELIDIDKEPTLFFRVIKNRQEVYDIITRAFARKKRWNELPHGLDLRNSWNFLWSWSKIRIDISKLLVWQKCNHFPQSRQM